MIPDPNSDRKVETPSDRLSEKHLADLQSSGLSDEQILRCGFRSITDTKQIGEWLGWTGPATKLGPCLCLPYYGPDGKYLNYVRVKPDRPRTVKGKPAKYESPLKAGNRLYFPPETRAVLSDHTVPILITEGEKKTAKADQEGFPCLGLSGVYCGLKSRSKDATGAGHGNRELIDDFNAVNLAGRTVLIVFDSDAATNIQVRWAEYHLGVAFREKGADVQIVRLPGNGQDEKVGLDDYLVAHGANSLRALIANAKPVEKPADDRPMIVIGVDEHRVNDEAAAALASEPDLFQRAGSLVVVSRTVDVTDPKATVRRSPGSVILRLLLQASVRERMARSAKWVTVREKDGEVEYVPAHPPAWSAAAVYARTHWPKVRLLDALLSHPVLLPDGSILATPGYHPSAALYLDLTPGLQISVPATVTKDHVRAAVKTLFDVLSDFPFETAAHKSAWLAGLLTPLAWFMFDGPAPLFLIDANIRAAGKGLLADVIAIILTGRRFPVMTYTPDREELRKRITALAAEGDRLVLMDNMAGSVGNDILDAALTSDRWKDRILGVNRVYDGPLHVTWFATGNNVQLAADTARRVCHIRLETPAENPENRAGFKVSDLRRHVRARRGELLSAALTILKGWCDAGRPVTGVKPWGSFEGWSGVVREAICFAGEPDPGETRMALQTAADRDAGAMSTILQCLVRLDPDRRGVTAAEVVEKLKDPPEPTPYWYGDLRAALEDLCGGLDTRRIGGRFRSFTRRVFDGQFLDKAVTEARAVRWAVFPASEFARSRAKPTHEAHETHSPKEVAGESDESGESKPVDPPPPAADAKATRRTRRFSNDDRGGYHL